MKRKQPECVDGRPANKSKSRAAAPGYSMNMGKTELIVMNEKVFKLKSLKEFNTQIRDIKYCGRYISPDKCQLVKDNYLPLVKD